MRLNLGTLAAIGPAAAIRGTTKLAASLISVSASQRLDAEVAERDAPTARPSLLQRLR
jgi:uncharacterized protein YciI